MTAILIRPEPGAPENARYRAVSGGRQSVGRTMGEAIDALTAEWGDEVRETTVLIQRFEPDVYFTAEQQLRLRDLLQRRDSLTPQERAELESLIDAELDATTARTAQPSISRP
jgi:hypothetical protein